jgi:hypothetical protein
MKLGDYEFEWVPDEMVIPRPEKTVAVQENLGNVGFFSWGPQLIGKEVKMKWKFTSVAQYEAFRALYLAGGVHVLDLTPETMVYDDGEAIVGNPEDLVYPHPLYPGVAGGPTYRRFYVGLIFEAEGAGDAQWPDINDPDHQYVFQDYQAFEEPQGAPSINEGVPKALSLVDPGNAYIEFDQDMAKGLPNWRPGSIIMDSQGNTWTVVLPWQDELRPYWIYPDPLLTTTKVYYRAAEVTPPAFYPEVSGSGPHFVEVRANPLSSRVYNSTFSDNGYSAVTECGEDAIGTWFKVRPLAGYSQVRLCAGEQPALWASGVGFSPGIDIMPWGP